MFGLTYSHCTISVNLPTPRIFLQMLNPLINNKGEIKQKSFEYIFISLLLISGLNIYKTMHAELWSSAAYHVNTGNKFKDNGAVFSATFLVLIFLFGKLVN